MQDALWLLGQEFGTTKTARVVMGYPGRMGGVAVVILGANAGRAKRDRLVLIH